MRKFSKGISILLAICMIIAMVPAAFAAEEPTAVTVSMLDSNIETTSINHTGNGAVSGGYTITWKDGSAELDYANTNIGYFRMVSLDKYYSLASGSYASVQFVFKTKLAAEGDYAIDLTPILTYYGGMYGVWVNDRYAGKVNSWYEGAAKGWTAKEGDKVSLNTLHITPDEEGYVTVKLKNLSTTYDATGTTADSYKDAYAVPLGFKEITFTPVADFSCTGINENITSAELHVGKTLDFAISPIFSDGSTHVFDTSDATNTITASVAEGSSVALSDLVMKEDGLHGKITGVATEAATINVAVTLDGVTTNNTINVTPKALNYETTTVSMHQNDITPTGFNVNGNGAITDSTNYNIVWNDGKTEFVKEKSNLSNLRKATIYTATGKVTPSFGGHYWPLGTNLSSGQLTLRTKLADGAYKVDFTPVMSYRGSVLGIWINGQYAGKVNTLDNEADKPTWYEGTYKGETASLNTLDITSDKNGWVEITIKNLSTEGVNYTTGISLGFKDIVFTPTDAPAVEALSENISSTDIYKGETYDFCIKAKMNDGNFRIFDTSDTTKNNMTATVNGSAVKLSDVTLKEDGLYGKITGVGEDEVVTINVTTTINGVSDTKTIKAISFAKTLNTPEKIVISMNNKGTYDVVHNKPNGMNFISESTLTWGDGTKVRLVKEKTHLTAFREYPGRAYISYGVITNPVAGTKDSFTMKVRASEGTYKVDLTYAETVGGCVYDVIIDGTNVGSVDCSGTTTAWYEPRDVQTPADLDNVTVTPDEEGWIEITLKWKEKGFVNGSTTTSCFFFKNITLTPTVKLYATAETVDGDVEGLVTASGYTAGEIADVAFGNKVALTANNIGDYKFLYWMNNSNNMFLSQEETLAVDATSNLSISAVYTKAGNTRYDYFTDSGERIASAFGEAPEAPAIPTKIGYDVSSVTWENQKSQTAADYEAYAPDYSTAVAKTFTATINKTAQEVSFNEEISLNGTDSDFSYWRKNGQIVSYNRAYSFFIWGADVVQVINYGKLAESEKKPAVVLFSNGNEHMLELVGFDGIEIVEKGILFANSGKPTIGSTLAKARSKTSNKQFAVSSDYAVARAYVVYRDGEDLKVIYSD